MNYVRCPQWGAAFSCKWKHSEKHVYKIILKQQQEENNGIFVVKCSAVLLLTSAEKMKLNNLGEGGMRGAVLKFEDYNRKFCLELLLDN